MTVIFITACITIVYAIMAAIWEFNPTNIKMFNGKLAISSIIAAIVSRILAGLLMHDTEIAKSKKQNRT